ncbi:MAG: hypothetical protein ACI89X_003935 [Planctomycetota bacterium]|jgi:hypothetical protein
MRTLLRSLSLVALALVASCKSSGDPVATELLDTPVYTRVGMRFDASRGRFLMHSTNYIGMAHHLQPGSKLTLKKASRKGFELVDDEGSTYVINYNLKHSLMPMAEWREQHFAEIPEKLTDVYTDDELDAIQSGQVREGMTRAAVFLAIGYPPKSNNPSMNAKVLKYEVRRPFISRSIRFDGDDKVEQVGRR